jgi:hypothetical protein
MVGQCALGAPRRDRLAALLTGCLRERILARPARSPESLQVAHSRLFKVVRPEGFEPPAY